jgi:hypothetical protein
VSKQNRKQAAQTQPFDCECFLFCFSCHRGENDLMQKVIDYVEYRLVEKEGFFHFQKNKNWAPLI